MKSTIRGNYDVFYRLALTDGAPAELKAFKPLLFEAMGRSDIDLGEENGDLVIEGEMGRLKGIDILGLASLVVPGYTEHRLHISDIKTFIVVPKAKITDNVPSELPGSTTTVFEDGDFVTRPRTWENFLPHNYDPPVELSNGDFTVESVNLDSDHLLVLASKGFEILSSTEYKSDTRRVIADSII